MKQKLYFTIVAFLFVLSTGFSLICYADLNQYVTIEKEKINDDEIVIHISVHGLEEGILGMQGTLNYDHDNLEITDIKINDENWMISAFNDENGKFLAEISDEAFFNTDLQLKGKDNFIDIIFKDLKKSNKYDIELTDIKLGNIDKTIESEPVKIKLKSTINIIVIIASIIFLIVACFCIVKRKHK